MLPTQCEPAWCSTNVNAPVPRMLRSGNLGSALSLAALYTQSHGDAKFDSIDALVFDSLNTTVSGSGVSMLAMSLYVSSRSERTPAGGFRSRS